LAKYVNYFFGFNSAEKVLNFDCVIWVGTLVKHHLAWLAVWSASGNIVGRINKVTLRWAGLLLRWGTIGAHILSWYVGKPPRSTQPGQPSMAMCTMLCVLAKAGA